MLQSSSSIFCQHGLSVSTDASPSPLPLPPLSACRGTSVVVVAPLGRNVGLLVCRCWSQACEGMTSKSKLDRNAFIMIYNIMVALAVCSLDSMRYNRHERSLHSLQTSRKMMLFFLKLKRTWQRDGCAFVLGRALVVLSKKRSPMTMPLLASPFSTIRMYVS